MQGDAARTHPTPTRPRPRWLRVTSIAAALLGGAILTTPLAAAPPADATGSEEQRVLELTNQVRASAGVPALGFDEAAAVTARRWAATVAAAGRISHNPDIPMVSSGPTGLAENVVVGPTIQMAQDALVASRGHYLNIVNPAAVRVGIGVTWSGGMVYIVEDFVVGRGTPVPTSPSTTTRPAPGGPSTVTPGPPVGAGPTTTLTGSTVTTARPAAVVGPPAGGPSPWLALSLDVVREWDGAIG